MIHIPWTENYPLPAYSCYQHDFSTQHVRRPRIYTIWPSQLSCYMELHTVYCFQQQKFRTKRVNAIKKNDANSKHTLKRKGVYIYMYIYLIKPMREPPDKAMAKMPLSFTQASDISAMYSAKSVLSSSKLSWILSTLPSF